MKNAVYTILFMLLFQSWGRGQNSIKHKMLISGNPAVLLFIKAGKPTKAVFNIDQLRSMSGPVEGFQTFVSNLPVIKLKDIPAKKPVSFMAEFLLNDMLENSISAVNGSLINTYDDAVPELFKDAPSLFRVKCIIQF